MTTLHQPPATLAWHGGPSGYLELIDQTLLPRQCRLIQCRTADDVHEAIRSLRVRGAPAIGIAAAYGLCLAMQHAEDDEERWFAALKRAVAHLASARPTAVNLIWALRRTAAAAQRLRGQVPPTQLGEALLAEARAIEQEDRQTCLAIGQLGAGLLCDGMGVLTHCNTGRLATGGLGTALAIIYCAVQAGKQLHVYATETRPLLQGARLTAWELLHSGISVTLVCDSMAGHLMQQGRVQAVLTGADRIASNGDTANKIGTYALAVLARHHGLPFYVAAPVSTFDLSLSEGTQIPIEERSGREITHPCGVQAAPDGVQTYNPAFDVTPAALITAIVCEHGIIRPVDSQHVALVAGKAPHPRGSTVPLG
ncbi:MAG: S-methyl-5-thioribose-1-phosphate isomerase [Pirellulales bacterium]|nr:S-methyl-5-thioribose-1-phosphate isomerase [Pirellulales bacterium]